MTDNESSFRVNMVMIASCMTILGILGSVFMFWNTREKQLWVLTEDFAQVERHIESMERNHIEQLQTLQAIRARQDTLEKIITTNTQRISNMDADFGSFKEMYYRHESNDDDRFKKLSPIQSLPAKID